MVDLVDTSIRAFQLTSTLVSSVQKISYSEGLGWQFVDKPNNF